MSETDSYIVMGSEAASFKKVTGEGQDKVRAIGCILVGAASSGGMNGMIRELSAGLHVFEIAFFRNFLGLILMLGMVVRGRLHTLRTRRFPLHLLRAALNAVAMLTFFQALALIPLAEVTALAFTTPLFAALLAVLVLKERMGPRRLVGLLVGLIGALIIIRPGMVPLSLGAFLVVFSSMVWACALMCIKVLSRTETSLSIAIYAALLLTPMTGIPAIFVWQWPTLEAWLLLFGVAATGSFYQVMINQAFKLADATLVMPFDFTKLIWASLIGYVFFSEVPDIWTIVGGAVIIASVTYITYREAQVQKASSDAAP